MPLCACLGGKEAAQAVKVEGEGGEEHGHGKDNKKETARKKVYVTRNIHQDAMAILEQHYDVNVWHSDNKVPRDKLIQDIHDVNAIICTVAEEIDEEIINAAGPNLKVICSMTSGVSHIAHEVCKNKGVQLHHVADICADANAEMTVGLLMMVAKRLMEGCDAVVRGEWGLWKPQWLLGHEFVNKTVGFLGFGRVGLGVARRLQGFNLGRLIYYSRKEHHHADTVHAVRVADPDKIFIDSDFIVCCLPLTEHTRGFVNKKNLSLCKPDCVLVNTSRADIIHQEDLLHCLQSGTIGGVGLDVTTPEPLPPTHPLVSEPRCVILPHMGTATTATRRRMAVHLANLVVETLK